MKKLYFLMCVLFVLLFVQCNVAPARGKPSARPSVRQNHRHNDRQNVRHSDVGMILDIIMVADMLLSDNVQPVIVVQRPRIYPRVVRRAPRVLVGRNVYIQHRQSRLRPRRNIQRRPRYNRRPRYKRKK